MAQAALKPMNAEEFLAWSEHREGRYEFIDGRPRMMTGASRRHVMVNVNVIAELRNQLRGKPCRPCLSDTAVKLPNGDVRRPDAMVDCGGAVDEKTWAHAPALIVEILSKSTAFFDQFRKLEDYKALPSLDWILFLHQDTALATLVSRQEGKVWNTQEFVGLAAEIRFPRLEVTLRLEDLYEGVDVEERAAEG